MQHTQIQNVCGLGASFFVLGPVGRTVGEAEKFRTFRPVGEDLSLGWPELGEVKLKQSLHGEANATKTLVFLGSKESRRKPKQYASRKTNEQNRAQKWGYSEWHQHR